MATIVIFWCAFLAGLFWLLTLLIKGTMSLISGLLKTIAASLVTGFFAGAGFMGLYLIYSIAQGVRQGNLLEMIGSGLVSVIGFIVVIGIMVYFGGWIMAIVASIATRIAGFLIELLTAIEGWVESAYYFFLNKVKFKIENS